MLEALILSQCQDGLVYPEDIPYAVTMRIGYGRVQRWLQGTWYWGTQNASNSDDAKAWSRTRYLDMLCSLYPDAIPF